VAVREDREFEDGERGEGGREGEGGR